MKYRQSCDTYILSNEVVSFWSEPKTTCFLFCGPIFIKEILIWGGIKEISENRAKNDEKINDSTDIFVDWARIKF